MRWVMDKNVRKEIKDKFSKVEGKNLRRRPDKGYLFVNPRTKRPWVDFRKILNRACDKAGIGQHVYMHLLRHGFGTHGIQSGIGLRTMQMLMGHSTSQVTERYVTLAAQFLSEEVQKLGSKRSAKNGS